MINQNFIDFFLCRRGRKFNGFSSIIAITIYRGMIAVISSLFHRVYCGISFNRGDIIFISINDNPSMSHPAQFIVVEENDIAFFGNITAVSLVIFLAVLVPCHSRRTPCKFGHKGVENACLVCTVRNKHGTPRTSIHLIPLSIRRDVICIVFCKSPGQLMFYHIQQFFYTGSWHVNPVNFKQLSPCASANNSVSFQSMRCLE